MKTNGRIICDELKRVRMELAKANGIDYQPTVCNHQGECAGTCPACEAELAELTRQIKEKKESKVIGVAPLKIAAVAAATSLSLSSCVPLMGGSAATSGPIETDQIADSDSISEDTNPDLELVGRFRAADVDTTPTPKE